MNPGSYRTWSTITIVLLSFNLGLSNSLFGPTLLDLRLIFNGTYQDISSAVAIRGVGVIIGALGAGFLVDAFDNYKLHVTAVAQVICVICVTVIPWLPCIASLWVVFAVLGVGNGIMQIGTRRTLLELWQSESPRILTVPRIASSTGGLLAPLLAAPFLATWEVGDITAEFGIECSLGLIRHQTVSSVSMLAVTPSKIQYAYICSGALIAVVTLPFLFVHFVSGWRTQACSYEDITFGLLHPFNSRPHSNSSKLYGSFIVFLSSIFAFNVMGIYFLYSNFLTSFAVHYYHEGKHVASLKVTFFHIASMVGSLLSFLLTRKFHINTVFAVYNVVHFISGLMLFFFHKLTTFSLWISTFLFGCCLSPLYSLLPGILNTQIEVKGSALSCIVIARGLGDFCYVWLTGYQFDKYGQSTFPYLTFVISTSTAFYGWLFVMVAAKHGNRFDFNNGKNSFK